MRGRSRTNLWSRVFSPWKAAKPLSAALLLLAGSACGHAGVEETRPPNFILFIADDMAWDDSGPYGHPGIRTPNLNRLAEAGMRFDGAFLTTSSCSPSRASIITGRYPHNTGAEQLHAPLPAEQVTFVELLRGAGYWTAAAGKWHLGREAVSKFDLVREGGGPSGCEDWVSTLRERPGDRPFFLWLAARDPHRPYEENIVATPHRPEDARVPPYLPDVPETRRDLALYYDEIHRLDGFMGEVLAELERRGDAENTLVLFISDNGRPFPRDKTTLYDSGIRTPWILRWPARVRAGITTPALVSAVDIGPTFLELAGVEPPPSMQGRSMTSLLDDPDSAHRELVFAEKNWHDFDDHARAVRSARFKYIRNYYTDIPNTPPADAVRSPTFQAMLRLRATGELTPEQSQYFRVPRPEEELYALESDPFELTNLAGDASHQQILSHLREVLEAWREETGDRIPARRRPDEFHRETGERLERPDR